MDTIIKISEPLTTLALLLVTIGGCSSQCLRRYKDTREAFPHLVNAGKYSTTFFVVLLHSLYTNSKATATPQMPTSFSAPLEGDIDNPGLLLKYIPTCGLLQGRGFDMPRNCFFVFDDLTQTRILTLLKQILMLNEWIFSA